MTPTFATTDPRITPDATGCTMEQPQTGTDVGYRLSRGEEIALARLAGRGDKTAVHRLVMAHQWLVEVQVRRAIRCWGGSIDFEDLVQECNLRLLEGAALKFDPRRGTRFSTFLTLWLRHWLETLIGADLRQPDYTYFSEPLRSRSNERDFDSCGDAVAAIDALPDIGVPVEQYVQEHVLREEIEMLLARSEGLLTDKEEHVVRARYGLDETRDWRTYQEVGSEMGFSRQHAQQVDEVALRKLRRSQEMSLCFSEYVSCA